MRWGMLSIFLLAGCGIAGDSALEREAKDAVAQQMKDPGSVQFRDLESYPDQGLVCGEINAKNSFGAYSGYSQFYYYRGDVWLDGTASDRAPNYGDMCDAAAAGERVPALSYNQRLVDRLPEGSHKRDLQKQLDDLYTSGSAHK